MQMVSIGSGLAAPATFTLGGLFSPFIAAVPDVRVLLTVLLCIILAIPAYFVVASIPLWLAAKIAVPGKTRFGQAVGTVISHFVAALLIGFLGGMVLFLTGFAAGRTAMFAVYILILIALFIAMILITAGNYGIGAFHAFAVQLLSGIIYIVAMILIHLSLLSMGSTIGTTLEASIQKLRGGQPLATTLPSMPSFGSSSAPSPAPAAPAVLPTVGSNSAEIDSLLNAAMHPDGPKPSLAERENIVRILQEKLIAEQNSLPAGDAHAALVFQNQRNRYLALLGTVKAERKLHPLQNEIVTEKPVGRDYASPAP